MISKIRANWSWINFLCTIWKENDQNATNIKIAQLNESNLSNIAIPDHNSTAFSKTYNETPISQRSALFSKLIHSMHPKSIEGNPPQRF